MNAPLRRCLSPLLLIAAFASNASATEAKPEVNYCPKPGAIKVACNKEGCTYTAPARSGHVHWEGENPMGDDKAPIAPFKEAYLHPVKGGSTTVTCDYASPAGHDSTQAVRLALTVPGKWQTRGLRWTEQGGLFHCTGAPHDKPDGIRKPQNCLFERAAQ